MMTFPVKSGMSFRLNLLLGGKDCEKREAIMPMVSLRGRYWGWDTHINLINSEIPAATRQRFSRGDDAALTRELV